MLRQQAPWEVSSTTYLSPALLAVFNWISIPWIACWNYSSAALSLPILNKFFQGIIVIQILLDSWFALTFYCHEETSTVKGAYPEEVKKSHNRGEDAVRLSCLLPSQSPSLFEWEDLVKLTNFDKWQNTRLLQTVLGLVFRICHREAPPCSWVSLVPPFSLCCGISSMLLFWLTLGIFVAESYSNCYGKHFIGFIAPWIVYTGLFPMFVTCASWFLETVQFIRGLGHQNWGAFWKFLSGSFLNKWKQTSYMQLDWVKLGVAPVSFHSAKMSWWMTTLILPTIVLLGVVPCQVYLAIFLTRSLVYN